MRRWDAHAVCHSSDPSGAAMALMEHTHGMSAGRRLTARPAQYAQYLFLFIQMFSIRFKFEPVKRWPFDARKFSNKIWNCRELNKKQLSPLELFKLQNGI
jgi:hypothetical protein